jgi:hypothetical protein
MSDICAPVLRSLIIENCDMETEVCISIPSLVSLQIKKLESGMTWLRNMSSLLKASVSLCCIEYQDEYKKSKYELLSGLSNVTYIELEETVCFAQVTSYMLFLFSVYLCLTKNSQFSNILINYAIYMIPQLLFIILNHTCEKVIILVDDSGL